MACSVWAYGKGTILIWLMTGVATPCASSIPIARSATAKPSLTSRSLPQKTIDESPADGGSIRFPIGAADLSCGLAGRRTPTAIGAASASIPARSLSGDRGLFRSSMRNLLDESSVAQSLDGDRLMGSLHVPVTRF